MRSNLQEKGPGIMKNATRGSGAKHEYGHVHIGLHWEEYGHPGKGSYHPPPNSALVWLHLQQCVPVWGSLFWRSGEELEWAHRRSAKMGLGATCGKAERWGLHWPGELEAQESIVVA